LTKSDVRPKANLADAIGTAIRRSETLEQVRNDVETRQWPELKSRYPNLQYHTSMNPAFDGLVVGGR